MTWLLSLAANPILRALWRPVAALLGLLGFGYLQRRKGAQEAKADRAADDAEAYRDTIEDVTNEKPSTDPVDVIRRRMRERAGRKP